jgi:hypothetical protein
MEWVIVGAVWLLCGIIAAVAADRKRFNGCLGAIAGFLLGPFGVILVLLWPATPPTAVQRGEVERGAERVCPHCRSVIPSAASVCRFCQREVPEVEVAVASSAAVPLSASVPPSAATRPRYLNYAIVIAIAGILLIAVNAGLRQSSNPSPKPETRVRTAAASSPDQEKRFLDVLIKRVNELDLDMVTDYRVSGNHLVVVVNADRWGLMSAQDQALTLKVLVDGMRAVYQQHHTDAEARTVVLFVQDMAGNPLAQRGVDSQ